MIKLCCKNYWVYFNKLLSCDTFLIKYSKLQFILLISSSLRKFCMFEQYCSDNEKEFTFLISSKWMENNLLNVFVHPELLSNNSFMQVYRTEMPAWKSICVHLLKDFNFTLLIILAYWMISKSVSLYFQINNC